MKKILSIVLVLMLILSLAACGKEKAPASTETAITPADEQTSGLSNPVHPATPESILRDCGFDLAYLAEYENAVFSTIDGDPVIMQVSLTKDGCDYIYRIATPPAETDISGMYYEWSETSEVEVGYNTAKLSLSKDGAGLVSWYDIVPGVMYTLSTPAGADAAALTALANELYHPTQGDVTGDPDVDASMVISADEEFGGLISACLAEIHSSYYPGTAGSSLIGAKYAAMLADLFTDYAPSAESVGQSVEHFLGDRSLFGDPHDAASFAEQINGIVTSFRSMVEHGVGILDDAGAKAERYPWPETVSADFDALQTAGLNAAYAEVLSRYAAALTEDWDGGKLSENNMNVVLRDQTVQDTGYALIDLDRDGVNELLICAMNDDDYRRAQVLELCCVNEFGCAAQVFLGGERNRLYYAGNDLFIHEGSNGANDSLNTTEQFAEGALNDLGYETAERVVPELIPFSVFLAR